MSDRNPFAPHWSPEAELGLGIGFVCVVVPLIALISGSIGCWIGAQRRRGLAGFVFGFFFGPFGWIIAALLPHPSREPHYFENTGALPYADDENARAMDHLSQRR